MSFFAKGDFKIAQSWEQKRPSSKKSRKKSDFQEESLMMKLGLNPKEPTTDIIDDSLSELLMKEMGYDSNPKSVKQPAKMPPTDKKKKQPASRPIKKEDEDLLAAMSKRLQKLQKTCENQRLEIKEKNGIIQKFKTENAFLKGMKEDSGKAYQEMEQLKQKNQELTKKVQEMQAYLKQYGLKWVGNKVSGGLDHQKMKKQISQAKHLYKLPSQIDIKTIQRRIQQLNAGLEQEGQGTQIYSDHGVHKFRKTQYLPIAFYSNGIVIKGYNFFPYKGKESLRILSDLVDGYFPYIFKQKYPNGVLLEVVDMVEQVYKKEISDNGNINSYSSVKEKQFQPQSKDEFLKKLPKQVIKEGKVIPIRDQIGKLFDPSQKVHQSDNCQNIEGQLFIMTETHKKVKANQAQIEDICTLKIRSQNGQIYLLRMEKQDKMTDVFKELQNVVKEDFKVMGNYPRRQYRREELENLEELGFFPNANLHVQK